MNSKPRKSNYLVFEQLEIKLSGNIAKSICICYNADRQKDVNSPLRTTTKTPGRHSGGFLLLILAMGRLKPIG